MCMCAVIGQWWPCGLVVKALDYRSGVHTFKSHQLQVSLEEKNVFTCNLAHLGPSKAVNCVCWSSCGLCVSLIVCKVDQQLQAEGIEVNLQEDPNLDLPFLIPEQGYSCDVMKGVPVGLEEYLEPPIAAGKGRATTADSKSGFSNNKI